MRLFLIDEDGNVIEKGVLTNNGFKFELISSQLNIVLNRKSSENLNLSKYLFN